MLKAEILRMPKYTVLLGLMAGIVIAAGVLLRSAEAQTPGEPTADLEHAPEPELERLEDLIDIQEYRVIQEEKKLVEKSLLDLQLAEVRSLVRQGQKTEAAAAMKEFKRAMAHFELRHAALKNFPSKISPETTSGMFREKDYIGVVISNGVGVYNSLRLDQPARVRHLLNERLLTLVKEFAEAAEGAGTYGLHVSLLIPYRSFLDEDQMERYDSLQLYLPMAEIKRFAEYEITSQDLIDSSVVIVNENRVSVILG